ncbi:hypothetical protein HY212_06365 [Candidatus Pacearchaeota archaeon]|nr:hypothetical protein [Candidatus Pacearchaeota archaeon]
MGRIKKLAKGLIFGVGAYVLLLCSLESIGDLTSEKIRGQKEIARVVTEEASELPMG